MLRICISPRRKGLPMTPTPYVLRFSRSNSDAGSRSSAPSPLTHLCPLLYEPFSLSRDVRKIPQQSKSSRSAQIQTTFEIRYRRASRTALPLHGAYVAQVELPRAFKTIAQRDAKFRQPLRFFRVFDPYNLSEQGEPETMAGGENFHKLKNSKIT